MKCFQMYLQISVKHLRWLHLRCLTLVWNAPNGLAIKLFDKIMQLILLGHHRDNLDWNKITDLQKL